LSKLFDINHEGSLRQNKSADSVCIWPPFCKLGIENRVHSAGVGGSILGSILTAFPIFPAVLPGIENRVHSAGVGGSILGSILTAFPIFPAVLPGYIIIMEFGYRGTLSPVMPGNSIP